MKNLYSLKPLLSPEQNKVFDDVLLQHENIVLEYKYLAKKYSDVKRNVRVNEKKMVALMGRLPENDWTPRRIENEIGAIENKYTAIEKAIRNYKQEMHSFDHIINMPNFRMFNPQHQQDWAIGGLKRHLSMAHHYIELGLDAIRITKRYFKNISEAFKWQASMEKLRNQRALLMLNRTAEQKVPGS
jgi:hypothetical protein